MHGRHATGSMIDGYQALTEKEKQTLRLILDGHDAKSMARQLGLSVHTVNERLRDARRKLSVSSSKAAARLLRQAEAADPESLGDRGLGDAAPTPVAHPSDPPGAAPRSRRALWAIGGFAMIAFVAAILALSGSADMSGAPAAADGAQAGSPAADSPSARAALDFLALLDASNWNASFAATGKQFQSVNTVQGWQSASEHARVPLGRVVSRRLVSDEWVPAPPSGYRIVRFNTDFAQKKNVVETVSLEKEGEAWKIVGITID